MTIKLHFFGAAGCVTGSCMLLETRAASVLIDCGLFQGSKTLKALNYRAFPFDPAALQAVLLTHAHIDHSGQLPKLALAGFRGPIWATQGTIELCGVLLPDAGAIQEMEVESLNRRSERSGGAPVAPIYSKRDAEACLRQFRATEFKVWTDIAPGVRARWWNAGHILGSASVEVEVREGAAVRTLLFSGDLGPGGRGFEPDPEGPAGVDHVVMESTYGNVVRAPLDQAQRRRALADEVMAAHVAGGPLLIPAFAVERTQELIVDLLTLIDDNRAPPGPIFLDSPLAIRATDVFLRHERDGPGGQPLEQLRESGRLRFTEGVDESRGIERMHGWHIIIAASGMCDAGRVRHHLKRLLWRPEATVMLVGYQAVGTLGRLLQDGRRGVRIQGDEIKVEARIRTLEAYSAHADANGLTAWINARAPISGTVFLTHGEPENSAGLGDRLRKAGIAGGRVVAVDLDQVFSLDESAAALVEPQAAPRIPPAAAARLDWHNARAELLAELRSKLEAAADDAAREKILADLTADLRRA